MKKNINKVVVCLFIIIILIVVLILFNKIKKNEIPDNPNLKIEVDMGGTPVSIITYYFYDDSIIETSYSGGVLPTGPVSYTITTKYHFNEKVDLTELMEFLNKEIKNDYLSKKIILNFNHNDISSGSITSSIKDKVVNIIDNCIDLDMYVIVDWHILSDNNPNNYKSEAIDFFEKICYNRNVKIKKEMKYGAKCGKTIQEKRAYFSWAIFCSFQFKNC